jgi:hypothetical protein
MREPGRPPPVIPATVRPPEASEETDVVESGLVFVRRPLKMATGPAYDGPFPVLAEREKVILVNFGQSQDWISKDRIKPYVGEGSPEVVCRKPRGRPRKNQ